MIRMQPDLDLEHWWSCRVTCSSPGTARRPWGWCWCRRTATTGTTAGSCPQSQLQKIAMWLIRIRGDWGIYKLFLVREKNWKEIRINNRLSLKSLGTNREKYTQKFLVFVYCLGTNLRKLKYKKIIFISVEYWSKNKNSLNIVYSIKNVTTQLKENRINSL